MYILWFFSALHIYVHKIRCKMLTHTPVNPTIYSARVLQITTVHNKSLAEGMVSSEKRNFAKKRKISHFVPSWKGENFRFFCKISHKSVSRKNAKFSQNNKCENFAKNTELKWKRKFCENSPKKDIENTRRIYRQI